jgi:hypothetical protein
MYCLFNFPLVKVNIVLFYVFSMSFPVWEIRYNIFGPPGPELKRHDSVSKYFFDSELGLWTTLVMDSPPLQIVNVGLI